MTGIRSRGGDRADEKRERKAEVVAFQSRGRVGIGEPLEIRVLSGVQFLESLCLFASAVQ
uniref:Uncharacterized protein n=1 Tax=Helianthus annuus TaxID=4232 RepID=A0A251T9G0_HELAN